MLMSTVRAFHDMVPVLADIQPDAERAVAVMAVHLGDHMGRSELSHSSTPDRNRPQGVEMIDDE